MHLDLLKYVSDRIHEESGHGPEAGPVITISREYGCPSKIIAGRLAEELDTKIVCKGQGYKMEICNQGNNG